MTPGRAEWPVAWCEGHAARWKRNTHALQCPQNQKQAPRKQSTNDYILKPILRALVSSKNSLCLQLFYVNSMLGRPDSYVMCNRQFFHLYSSEHSLLPVKFTSDTVSTPAYVTVFDLEINKWQNGSTLYTMILVLLVFFYQHSNTASLREGTGNTVVWFHALHSHRI